MAKKILLIEDEPEHILILRARLEHAGYEIIEARDGNAGFNKARTEKPDLIILDILMPGLDGFGVCRLLKADPSTKSIPILVLTAIVIKELANKCLECGANDFMQKPWDAKELEGRIAFLLKK